MEAERKSKILIGVLVAVIFLGWFKYDQLKEENIYLDDQIDEYRDALSEANQNIDDANSMIEDAKSSTWLSYEDMGYALENLEIVETVSEPGVSFFGLPSFKLPSVELPKLPNIEIPSIRIK